MARETHEKGDRRTPLTADEREGLVLAVNSAFRKLKNLYARIVRSSRITTPRTRVRELALSIKKTTLLVVVTSLLSAVSTFAQTTVRVTRDQTAIWRPGFAVVATTVQAGTELEVVARRGDWYEVLLPAPVGTRETGFIAVTTVEVIGGAAAATPSRPQRPLPTTPRQPSARRGRTTPAGIGFRPYGQLGYGWQSARQTFDAIVGSPRGVWFGGGGNYAFSNGLFVQGSFDMFRRSGQRVFVFGGQVFRLGISDTITMFPLAVTAGYRFTGAKATPYVGGGIGQTFYKESSQFADPPEEVSRHFTSFHLLGGIEWRQTKGIGTAVEIQWTHIGNDLAGGVADAFGEHDLGSVQARVKILFRK